MKSIALILLSQKKAFENIGSEFTDELHKKSIYIFGVYGLTIFFSHFSLEENQKGFYLNLLNLVLIITISIISFVIISYLIFWISKKLNGIAEDMEIESIISHSLIPIILSLLIILFLKESPLVESTWNTPYLRNGLIWLSWFFSIFILIQGTKWFNEFSYMKCLLAISPIIICDLVLLLIYLIVK